MSLAFFNKPGLLALMRVFTSTPPNFPFRTFAVLMTYKPTPIIVRTERTSGDTAPSSIASCFLPTLTIKFPLLTFLSHLMRFRSLSSALFLQHLITQLAGRTILPSVCGSPMSILTFLLTTASQFVVAVPEIVPGLTALLWATATFTKSQLTGRGLFGTHTFPMFLSMNLWPRSFTVPWNTADAIPRSTIERILTSYKELCSQYQAGLHAWRLPPHTLAYNLYTLIFSLYALHSLLPEGFGAGAYSAAVAALMAYRPPSRAEYSKFDCVLTCLGGIAMPPKIFQELLDVYYKAHSQQLELANDSAAKGHVYDESSFTHSLRIVQHVHDRISPWSLNEILLNYIYNRGVAVLTLHDGVDAQRAYAELHNQTPFKPWSHFGDYRQKYEKVVPTLKYFSAATFLASFLAPLTYEQLEAREGTLGATYWYCPDLLDLLLGLFSYMGIVPPLHFGATIDALTPVLLRGCHREPNGDIIPMLHTTMEIHESPEAFYSRTFLQLLRIPALKNLPLPQALDFLHSQLLSSMCISPPVRKDNEPPAPFVSPPLKRHFQWPPGTPDPPPAPPSFHVWITRKVAPHMAVVDLRCDTVPWACFRRGPAGQHQHQFGIHSGDFIQFVFPATDDYPADCGFFSFALYITKVALKGRVVLENPDQVGDPSAAQVTQLVGIVLPFLLHNSVQIRGGKGAAPVSQALYQLRLPVLDR